MSSGLARQLAAMHFFSSAKNIFPTRWQRVTCPSFWHHSCDSCTVVFFCSTSNYPGKKKKKPVKYLIFGAKVKGLRPYHLLQIRKTQTKQPNPLQLCNKPSRQIPFPMFLCLYFLKKKDFSANTGNTEGVWTSIGGGGEEKEKGKDQDTRAAAAAREGNHAPH